METNTTTRLNRYPGAQPFQTSQEAIFFGREEDRAQLHRYVKLESLVVLYAKSGLERKVGRNVISEADALLERAKIREAIFSFLKDYKSLLI